ncbi:MAG: hypothetical protein GOVbin2937_1 [Prokaryotic dsDNA virus sp.]|nr:MAG: hypothetical protein GOVbin2937_1 [Prokaryotic dsDNA virus sp.]
MSISYVEGGLALLCGLEAGEISPSFIKLIIIKPQRGQSLHQRPRLFGHPLRWLWALAIRMVSADSPAPTARHEKLPARNIISLMPPTNLQTRAPIQTRQ